MHLVIIYGSNLNLLRSYTCCLFLTFAANVAVEIVDGDSSESGIYKFGVEMDRIFRPGIIAEWSGSFPTLTVGLSKVFPVSTSLPP